MAAERIGSLIPPARRSFLARSALLLLVSGGLLHLLTLHHPRDYVIEPALLTLTGLEIPAPRGEQASILTFQVELEEDTDYYLQMRARGEPQFKLRLYDQAYDHGKREILFPYGDKGLRQFVIDSGRGPQPAQVRFTLDESGPLTIEQFNLFRIAPRFHYIRCLLLGLILAVLIFWLYPYRRRPAAQAAALGLLAFSVYLPLTMPELRNRGDNFWYVPSALSMLEQGDFELSEYRRFGAHSGDYRLVETAGGLYAYHPPGAALASLPLVWWGNRFFGDIEHPLDRAQRIAGLAAKIWAALAVGLFYLLGRRLTSAGPAALLALLFAFTTGHFSAHAGGLWSHNVLLPFLLTALCLLAGRRAWRAALPLTLGCAVRPDFLIVGFVATLFVWRHRPGQLLRFIGVAAGAGLFLALVFDALYPALPPYFQTDRVTTRAVLEAMAGTLISPNRGLFVFTPLFLFSVWGAKLSFSRSDPTAVFCRYLALMVFLHWFLISLHNQWWGGWSYGPRLFAPVLPVLTALLVPVLERVPELSGTARRRVLGAMAVLALWGLFVQIRGLSDWDVHDWNTLPDIDFNRQRLWRWSEWQILH